MKEIWQKERAVEHFETREELEKYLKELVCPGDVVLLKGGRPCGLERILDQYNL